jgi:hypothetical protein
MMSPWTSGCCIYKLLGEFNVGFEQVVAGTNEVVLDRIV